MKILYIKYILKIFYLTYKFLYEKFEDGVFNYALKKRNNLFCYVFFNMKGTNVIFKFR